MGRSHSRRNRIAGGSQRGALGAGGYALAAPVVTWISDADTAQAIFEMITPPGTIAGYKIYGEADDGALFTSLFDTESQAISAGDLVDLQIDAFAFAAFPDGLMYARFCILNSSDVQISAWSNTVSQTITADQDYAAWLMAA